MHTTVHAIRSPDYGDSGSRIAMSAMSLEDAAYHTAHDYPGGVPALALRLRTSANTLNHKVNPHNNTHHLSLREARDAMVMSGDFRILYALASDLGHVAIQVDGAVEGWTMDHVMAATREFGELLAEVGSSTAPASESGRKISRNEMRRIEAEAGELISSINSLLVHMRSQVSEG